VLKNQYHCLQSILKNSNLGAGLEALSEDQKSAEEISPEMISEWFCAWALLGLFVSNRLDNEAESMDEGKDEHSARSRKQLEQSPLPSQFT
jgi:hypothetical protein